MPSADPAWFAALARLILRNCWPGIFPVPPATLLTWHRQPGASKYDASNRPKPGRQPTVLSIARIIVRLAKENPLWGYRGVDADGQIAASLPVADSLPPQGQDDNNDDHDDNDRPDTDIHG